LKKKEEINASKTFSPRGMHAELAELEEDNTHKSAKTLAGNVQSLPRHSTS